MLVVDAYIIVYETNNDCWNILFNYLNYNMCAYISL